MSAVEVPVAADLTASSCWSVQHGASVEDKLYEVPIVCELGRTVTQHYRATMSRQEKEQVELITLTGAPFDLGALAEQAVPVGIEPWGRGMQTECG